MPLEKQPQNPVLDLDSLDLELPTPGSERREQRENEERHLEGDIPDLDKEKKEKEGEEGGKGEGTLNDEGKEGKKGQENGEAGKEGEGKKEGKTEGEGKVEGDGALREGDEGDGDEEEATIIGLIKSRFGYDFGEIEFPDDEDGIVSIALAAAEKKFEQQIEQFTKDSPEAAKFFEFLQNGGNPADYVSVMAPEVNYLSIAELKDDDVPMQERLIRDNLLAQGEEEESIRDAISEYKASNILKSEAKRALSRLQRDQREEQETINERQKQVETSRLEQNQKWFEERTKEVKAAKDIQGLPITEKDKDPFLSFIKINDNGKSKYTERIPKLTPSQVTAIQYLVYKDFDFTKLIDTKAKTKQAETLTERLRGKGNGNNLKGGGGSNNRKSGPVDVNTLDLSIPA